MKEDKNGVQSCTCSVIYNSNDLFFNKKLKEKVMAEKIKWTDTQFLYCYECIYPIYTSKVKENNGVWECDECGITNNINKG